jgi:hypothetical protein
MRKHRTKRAINRWDPRLNAVEPSSLQVLATSHRYLNLTGLKCAVVPIKSKTGGTMQMAQVPQVNWPFPNPRARLSSRLHPT